MRASRQNVNKPSITGAMNQKLLITAYIYESMIYQVTVALQYTITEGVHAHLMKTHD